MNTYTKSSHVSRSTSGRGFIKPALVILCVAMISGQMAMASDYLVTVGAGVTNTVDDTFVQALGSADRLVKRGTGVLELNAKMASYAGEIVAEEGVLLAKETGSFGTSAGATVVSNGASVVIQAADTDKCKFYAEKFKIAGNGAAGEKGAFANIGVSLTGANFRYMTLLDDATIYAWGELSLYAGELNMNGKTLSLYVRDKNNSGATSWDYSFTMARSRVINPGNIILETGKFTVTGQTLSDGTAIWDGDDTNTLTIRPKTRFCLSSSLTTLPWKVIFESNEDSYAGFLVSGDANTASCTNNSLMGTVELRGPTIPFSYTSKQTGLANLLGNLTGIGGFTCTGYTQLHLWGLGSFEGLADISGNDTCRTPLTLHNGRALPVAGLGLKVRNANLALAGTDLYELPKVQFTNSTEYAITGATSGGTMAGLEKQGIGVLNYDTTLAVTGTLHIAAGVVRVPAISTRVQAAGVMEGTTNFTNSTDGDSNWHNYYASRPVLSQQLDSVRYPYLTAQPLWAKQIAGIRYQGYLWNHSSTNETWSFMSGVQRRSRLYVNGSNVFGKNSWKCQISANHAVFGHAVLKPGANKFDYYMEVSASTTGGAGGSKLDTVVDFDGTVYSATTNPEDFSWCLYKGLAYNALGSESHNEADYQKFENLSDGMLMTVTNDFTHLTPQAKLSANEIAIDHGAMLDLTEKDSVLRVQALACSGAITNGNITIGQSLVVPAGTISAGGLDLRQAILTFADDAVVTVDNLRGLDRSRREGNAYVIVTSDTAFAAAPSVSAALAKRCWYTKLSDDGRSVLLYHKPKGTLLLFR